MRKWKQMLSIILVAVMMSGLIPQTAYATVSDNSLTALEQEGTGISNNDLLIEPNKEIVSTDTLSGNDDATISSNAPTIVRIEVSGNNVDYENNEVSISCLRGMEERVLPKVNFYAYLSDGKVIPANNFNYYEGVNFYVEMGSSAYSYSVPFQVIDSKGATYTWEERPSECTYKFSKVQVTEYKYYDDWNHYFYDSSFEQVLPNVVPTMNVSLVKQYELNESIGLSSVTLYRNMKLKDAGYNSENNKYFSLDVEIPYSVGGQSATIRYSEEDWPSIGSEGYYFDYIWDQDEVDTSKVGTYLEAVRAKIIPKYYGGIEGLISKPIDLVIKDVNLEDPVITYDEKEYEAYGQELVQTGSKMNFICKTWKIEKLLKTAKVTNPADYSTYDSAIRKHAFSAQKNGQASVSENYLGLAYTIEKPSCVSENEIASITLSAPESSQYNFFLNRYANDLEGDIHTLNIPISDLKENNLSYFQYDNGALSFKNRYGRVDEDSKLDRCDYYDGIELHGRYLISYLDVDGKELAVVPIDIVKNDIYESVFPPLLTDDITVANATSIGGTGTLTVDCKSANCGAFEYYDTKKQEWIAFSSEDDIDEKKNGITVALESGRSYSVRKYFGMKGSNYYPETPGVNFVIRDVLDFRVLKNGQTIEQAVAEDGGKQNQRLENLGEIATVEKGKITTVYDSYFTSASATPKLVVTTANTGNSSGQTKVANAYVDNSGAVCVEALSAGTADVTVIATDSSGIYGSRKITFPITVINEEGLQVTKGKTVVLPKDNYHGRLEFFDLKNAINYKYQISVNNESFMEELVTTDVLDFDIPYDSLSQGYNTVDIKLKNDTNSEIVKSYTYAIYKLDQPTFDKAIYNKTAGYFKYTPGTSKEIQLTAGFTEQYYKDVANVKVEIYGDENKVLTEADGVSFDNKTFKLKLASGVKEEDIQIYLSAFLTGKESDSLEPLKFTITSTTKTAKTTKAESYLLINGAEYKYATKELAVSENHLGFVSGTTGNMIAYGLADKLRTSDYKLITYQSSNAQIIKIATDGSFTIVKAPTAENTVVALTATITTTSNQTFKTMQYVNVMQKPEIYKWGSEREIKIATSMSEITNLSDYGVFTQNLYFTTKTGNVMSEKQYVEQNKNDFEKQTYIATSMQPAIVKISENGNLYAVGVGTTKIRITAKDNLAKYIDIPVTVVSEKITDVYFAFEDGQSQVGPAAEFISCVQGSTSTVYAQIDYDSELLSKEKMFATIRYTTKQGKEVTLTPTKVTSSDVKNVLVSKGIDNKPTLVTFKEVALGYTTLVYQLVDEDNKNAGKLVLYVYRPDYTINSTATTLNLVKGGYSNSFTISSPKGTKIKDVSNSEIQISDVSGNSIGLYSIESYGDGNEATVTVESNPNFKSSSKKFQYSMDIVLLDAQKASEEELTTQELKLVINSVALSNAKVSAKRLNTAVKSNKSLLTIGSANVPVERIEAQLFEESSADSTTTKQYFVVENEGGNYYLKTGKDFDRKAVVLQSKLKKEDQNKYYCIATDSKGVATIRLNVFYLGSDTPVMKLVKVKLNHAVEYKSSSDKSTYVLTDVVEKGMTVSDNTATIVYQISTPGVNVSKATLLETKVSNISSHAKEEMSVTSEDGITTIKYTISEVVFSSNKNSGTLQPVFLIESSDLNENPCTVVANKVTVKKNAPTVFTAGSYYFNFDANLENSTLGSQAVKLAAKSNTENKVDEIISNSIEVVSVPKGQSKETAKAAFVFKVEQERIVVEPTVSAKKGQLKTGAYKFKMNAICDKDSSEGIVTVTISVGDRPKVPTAIVALGKVSVYAPSTSNVRVEIPYVSQSSVVDGNNSVVLKENNFYEIVPGTIDTEKPGKVSFDLRVKSAVSDKTQKMPLWDTIETVTLKFADGNSTITKMKVPIDKTKPLLNAVFYDTDSTSINMSLRDSVLRMKMVESLKGKLFVAGNDYNYYSATKQFVFSSSPYNNLQPVMVNNRIPVGIKVGRKYKVVIADKIYNHSTAKLDTITSTVTVGVKR